MSRVKLKWVQPALFFAAFICTNIYKHTGIQFFVERWRESCLICVVFCDLRQVFAYQCWQSKVNVSVSHVKLNWVEPAIICSFNLHKYPESFLIYVWSNTVWPELICQSRHFCNFFVFFLEGLKFHALLVFFAKGLLQSCFLTKRFLPKLASTRKVPLGNVRLTLLWSSSGVIKFLSMWPN